MYNIYSGVVPTYMTILYTFTFAGSAHIQLSVIVPAVRVTAVV